MINLKQTTVTDIGHNVDKASPYWSNNVIEKMREMR